MDFKGIVNTIFVNKNDWQNVTDKDKEELFFIFNRYMAKKYPKQAQFFNCKNVDKATAMDLWFLKLKTEPRIPYWFWTGSTKKKDPAIKDWQLIQSFWNMSLNDIYLLCELFPTEVKDEIKRIQAINEEQQQ